MSFNFVSKVPFVKGHSHFYDEIVDFPALHPRGGHHNHGPQLSRKEKLLNHLRNDLIEAATNPELVQKKLCYRECFKLMDGDYTRFCLQRKCEQNDIMEASRIMGLLK